MAKRKLRPKQQKPHKGNIVRATVDPDGMVLFIFEQTIADLGDPGLEPTPLNPPAEWDIKNDYVPDSVRQHMEDDNVTGYLYYRETLMRLLGESQGGTGEGDDVGSADTGGSADAIAPGGSGGDFRGGSEDGVAVG